MSRRLASRVGATALASAAALAIAACGSSGSSTETAKSGAGGGEKPVRIAFLTSDLANTYATAVANGVKDAAKAEGATVQVFGAQNDPKKQFAAFQDALTSGKFDAYVMIPLDAVSLTPLLKRAIGGGAKIGAASFALGPDTSTTKPQFDGVSASVLDPAQLRGGWIGGLVASACKDIDPCKVVWLPGTTTLPADVAMGNAMRKAIASHPNIEIVASQPGSYLSAPALKAVQNILQAHPDVNVIASSGDQMIIGAQLALKSAGKTAGTGPDQVRLIGLGATSKAIEGIKNGTWFGTVLSVPHDEGRLATEAVIKAVRGKLDKPLGVSASALNGQNPEITKETLSPGFKSQWDG